MGYALARAALTAGHKVTLISAVSNLRAPAKAEFVSVESSGQMFAAVKKCFQKTDCLIMAAAVADYTPIQPAKNKIKKAENQLVIKLKPTVDILKWARKNKSGKGRKQVVVGFALEDRDLRGQAEKKLKAKGIDMIIGNTVAAIGAEKSTVHIKTQKSSWSKIQNATKAVTAKKIIRQIEELVETGD